MSNQDNLRQQMWELVYGLLSKDDAAALEKRIDSESAVAQLFADIMQETDLVAQAAQRIEKPID